MVRKRVCQRDGGEAEWSSGIVHSQREKLDNSSASEKEGFRFIIIGGWAAYLWTKQHKSKDIDVIIPDYETLSFLKKKYVLNKNDNLKKYEVKFEEIDLDIYVPHYSTLALPVQDALKNTSFVEGFEVVSRNSSSSSNKEQSWKEKTL